MKEWCSELPLSLRAQRGNLVPLSRSLSAGTGVVIARRQQADAAISFPAPTPRASFPGVEARASPWAVPRGLGVFPEVLALEARVFLSSRLGEPGIQDQSSPIFSLRKMEVNRAM